MKFPLIFRALLLAAGIAVLPSATGGQEQIFPHRGPGIAAGMQPVGELAAADVMPVGDALDLQATTSGGLTILDMTGAGDKFAWAIVPADTSGFEVDTGGRRAYFAPGHAGRFTVIVAAATDDAVVILQREVTVGTPSPVDPTDPPVDPPPPSALTAKVKSLTQAAIAAGGDKATGVKLAGLYTAAASRVANGEVTPALALPGLKVALNALLSTRTDQAKWLAWRGGIDTELLDLFVQGRLSTKEQMAAVLTEIGTAAHSTSSGQANSAPAKKG